MMNVLLLNDILSQIKLISEGLKMIFQQYIVIVVVMPPDLEIILGFLVSWDLANKFSAKVR